MTTYYIEDALYSKLSGDSSISSIVGTRIYPVKMPDDPTFPVITYQRISSIREPTMSGRSEYCDCIFQIDSWSLSYDTTKQLAESIFLLLEGFKGVVSSVDIQAILTQNEIDLYEDDVKVFRRSQTYRIVYSEGAT